MLRALLLLLPQSAAPAPWPLVAVEGSEHVEAVEIARSGRVVLPLASRSERVPRPAATPRGLGIVLVAGEGGLAVGAARVHLLEHATDERVVLAAGEWTLVGPARLPRSSAPRADDLAWLARQDGGAVEGELELALEAREGERLVVLPGEERLGDPPRTVSIDGVGGAFDPGPNAARIVAALASTARLVAPAPGVDQVLLAPARTLESAAGEPLEARLERRALRALASAPRLGLGPDRPRFELGPDASAAAFPVELAPGEGLVLRVDPRPPSGEGRVQTLLLELELAWSASEPSASIAAAAPRSPWVDATRAAGIGTMHLEGPDEQLDIRPTMGPGAAWGDVDGDGWPDLFLVQGSGRAGSRVLPDRLYRNLGDGRFEDVTERAGVGDLGAGMGALFLDADGDGDLDLYVANFGRDHLYENLGAGTFRDASAGLPELELWSAGVCAGDVDGDGDLDLYVTSYLDDDPQKMIPAEELGRYQREDPLAMLPFAFPGQRNVLLRNEGGLCFSDATEEAGVADALGRGMQPVFWDHDGDGDLDLYVANDVSPNVLFENDGRGKFRDAAFRHGLDDPRGGMGLALGDVEGDGDEDLFLTNWQLESNALYLSALLDRRDPKHRRATYRDATVAAGMGPYGVGYTSWGAELFDLENDGDLDLFVANGYTSPDYEGTGICVGQRNHLFENDGRGRFTERGGRSGPALAPELPARAVAACDYDRDGDVDLLVTANNSFPQLLRNEEARAGHWLGVALAGGSPNTRGIGARVTVSAGERSWTRSLRAGTSYLAGNPPELHFGLGASAGPVEVAVLWPDGTSTRHVLAEVDRWVTLAP